MWQGTDEVNIHVGQGRAGRENGGVWGCVGGCGADVFTGDICHRA